MRTQSYRFTRRVIPSICLLLILQHCAWICGQKEASELIKPRPVGGYEALSTRIYYPQDIRESGLEGTVIIKALISTEGQVMQIQVAQALNPTLDQIVVDAIKRTPFEPATRNDQPEQVWVSIPIVFALKDWYSKVTPFVELTMTIYPDPAYKNFEVEISGHLKEGLEGPQRFECLLPFNATNPWLQTRTGRSHNIETLAKEKGEWLIFSVSSQDIVFGFTYKTIGESVGRKFLYEFAMNQALPEWTLSVVYGSQSVHFAQTPDRIVTRENGDTQFEYDMSAQNAYEERYLEIALQ